MTSLRLLPAIVFLLAARPTDAHAQALPLSQPDSALLLQLASPLRSVVLPALDSAQAALIPVEPLIDKALEGQSKGAPPDRIVAAVDGLLALMRDARSALGSSASPPELAAGASALHAGAPLNALSELRAARPHDAVTVPLGVMSELIARGVTPTTSARLVVALAREGTSDANLVALRKRVDLDLAAGIPPSVSAVRNASQEYPGLAPGPGGKSGGGGGAVPDLVVP